LDFLTTVISSCEAGLAFVTDDIGFDSDTVSDFEVSDRRMDCQYNSRRLVSQDMCVFDDHRTYAPGVPEVNIGTANSSEKLLTQPYATNPQIPVLLIPTVTSPGFKLSPFCTLSTEGVASATHRSCAGFVYTPMLAFDGFSIIEGGISVAEGLMIAACLLFISPLLPALVG
jgi:hypothetical protein